MSRLNSEYCELTCTMDELENLKNKTSPRKKILYYAKQCHVAIHQKLQCGRALGQWGKEVPVKNNMRHRSYILKLIKQWVSVEDKCMRVWDGRVGFFNGK